MDLGHAELIPTQELNKEVSELTSAELHLVKCVQQEKFSKHLTQLKDGKQLSKGSRLAHFLPFIEEHDWVEDSKTTLFMSSYYTSW